MDKRTQTTITLIVLTYVSCMTGWGLVEYLYTHDYVSGWFAVFAGIGGVATVISSWVNYSSDKP